MRYLVHGRLICERRSLATSLGRSREREQTVESSMSLGPPTPTGEPASEVLTFLFTDVRHYTRFTVERRDEVAARMAAKLASVTREEVAAGGGEGIELQGDEALAVFTSAR
jgi:class 3 adenylate cyclase